LARDHQEDIVDESDYLLPTYDYFFAPTRPGVQAVKATFLDYQLQVPKQKKIYKEFYVSKLDTTLQDFLEVRTGKKKYKNRFVVLSLVVGEITVFSSRDKQKVVLQIFLQKNSEVCVFSKGKLPEDGDPESDELFSDEEDGDVKGKGKAKAKDSKKKKDKEAGLMKVDDLLRFQVKTKEVNRKGKEKEKRVDFKCSDVLELERWREAIEGIIVNGPQPPRELVRKYDDLGYVHHILHKFYDPNEIAGEKVVFQFIYLFIFFSPKITK